MSPFRLTYGVQPRLPIELELPSGQSQLSTGSLCERPGGSDCSHGLTTSKIVRDLSEKVELLCVQVDELPSSLRRNAGGEGQLKCSAEDEE